MRGRLIADPRAQDAPDAAANEFEQRLADIHRGQQITLLQMHKSCFLMEASNEFMVATYLQLNQQVVAGASEAQAQRAATNVVLDDYAREVDGLAELLKRAKS